MVYSMVLPVRIFHHVIVTLIILFWFLKYGIPRSHLLWPLLTVWVSVIISALAADDKRMALEFAWHWITNGVFLLMLTDWFRAGQAEEMFTFQFAAGGLIAASCLLEWLLYGGRPGGMLFNINLAGGYLAALVVPLFAWMKSRKTSLQHIYFGALLALVGVAIVLNQSRGALLSVAVAFAVFLLLRQEGRLFSKRRLLLFLPLGLVAAVLLMSLQPGHALGDVDRIDLWRVAMDLIQSRTLGVGPGLFGQAYQTLGVGDQNRFTGAHNLYLTIGAELGGAGLASGAAMVLMVLYGLIQHKRTVQQDASLAALIGIMAHMTVDNFPSQGFAFLVSLYVAHLLYEWQPSFSLSKLKTLPVGLALVSCVFMLSSDRAQIPYERSLATGSYNSAFEAASLDPDNRLYRINLIRAAHDGDLTAAETEYPELRHSPNLMVYGMVNFGRVFQ
jgi:O-antigen ligase